MFQVVDDSISEEDKENVKKIIISQSETVTMLSMYIEWFEMKENINTLYNLKLAFDGVRGKCINTLSTLS